MVGAGHLNISRAWNVLCEPATVTHIDEQIVSLVQDQGGYGDAAGDITYVDSDRDRCELSQHPRARAGAFESAIVVSGVLVGRLGWRGDVDRRPLAPVRENQFGSGFHERSGVGAELVVVSSQYASLSGEQNKRPRAIRMAGRK